VHRFAIALTSGLLVLATVLGCGYRLVGQVSEQSPELAVSLRTLTNDSVEPGVELMVSDALRRVFLRATRIRLVEESSAADYEITGRVLPLETVSRTFTPGVRALEYIVVMRLELEVQGRGGKRLKLDRFSLSESEIYLASADVQIGRKNRDEALRRLSALLADRIYDEIDLLTSGGRG